MNFFTKQQQQNFIKNNSADNIKKAYNNLNDDQKNKLKQNFINTEKTNFTAEEYNQKARQNGEANWQTAYRRDILGINDEQKNKTPSPYDYKGDENNQIIPQNEKIYGQNQNIQNTNPEVLQNQEKIQENTSSKPYPLIEEEAKQNPQNQSIDYQNWNVESWKSRGSNKNELETAIEKKYNTVATWGENGKLTAVINGEKFEWSIDENGNPQKVSLGMANQSDLNFSNLNQMLQAGNSFSDLNDFVYKNNLQDSPEAKKILENKLKDDYEKPIIDKYKNYSLQDLHNAIRNGEIFPGTEVFEKLPQANLYNQYKSSFAIIDAEKEISDNVVKQVTDIEKIVEAGISKFFDTSGVKELSDEFKNDTEMQNYRNDIYNHQKNIAYHQKQLKDLADEVRAQMGGAPESVIQAEIGARAEGIYRSIETETNLMQAAMGMIDMKKSDFNIKLGMLEYSDNMKKQQYTTALNQYQTNRSRMDEFEKLNLQYKNQELAFNRQQKAQREMLELQQKYKGGTYQVGADGSLNYIIDGAAQKVKFDDGKTLFTKNVDDGSQISTKINDDGTFSTFRVDKNGNVNIKTYDMDSNLISGVPDRMFDAISSIGNGKQCGEGVNDYLQKMGLNRIFKNGYDQKLAYKDSEVPAIGSIAIYNPASHEYGHVAIVTGVSPDGETVYVTDWNMDGKGSKSENRPVPLSQILANGGGFHYPAYVNNNSSGKQIINSNQDIGFTNNIYSPEDLATARSIAKGKSNINNYAEKDRAKYNLIIEQLQEAGEFYIPETDSQAKKIKTIIDDLDNLLTNERWTLESLSGTINGGRIFGKKDARVRNLINHIVSNNVLQTLIDAKANGATFGALSDTELQMLKDASLQLTSGWKNETTDGKKRDWYYDGQEDEFIKQLQRVLEVYRDAYSKMTGISLNNPAGL